MLQSLEAKTYELWIRMKYHAIYSFKNVDCHHTCESCCHSRTQKGIWVGVGVFIYPTFRSETEPVSSSFVKWPKCMILLRAKATVGRGRQWTRCQRRVTEYLALLTNTRSRAPKTRSEQIAWRSSASIFLFGDWCMWNLAIQVLVWLYVLFWIPPKNVSRWLMHSCRYHYMVSGTQANIFVASNFIEYDRLIKVSSRFEKISRQLVVCLDP